MHQETGAERKCILFPNSEQHVRENCDRGEGGSFVLFCCFPLKDSFLCPQPAFFDPWKVERSEREMQIWKYGRQALFFPLSWSRRFSTMLLQGGKVLLRSGGEGKFCLVFLRISCWKMEKRVATPDRERFCSSCCCLFHLAFLLLSTVEERMAIGVL